MTAVNPEDYMKFMMYSEPIPLPKDIHLLKGIMKKFDESCLVVRNSDSTFFVGRPISSKSNLVSYCFRELDGTERHLEYGALRQIWLPRHLCPEQMRRFNT